MIFGFAINQTLVKSRSNGRISLFAKVSDPLVREGHGARSGEILRSQFPNPKSRGGNDLVDSSIQMATAADVFPKRRQPVLPFRDAWVGSVTVLHKHQLTFRFQYAFDLLKRSRRIGNGA